MDDLNPINTKLDTVVSDTTTLKSTTNTIDSTTKDTNSKVTSMKATVDTINTSVEEIKNNPSNGEKWVYSGETGTEKILINNVNFLADEEITLYAETDRYLNKARVIGFFVPKVSGIHTITITAGTLNASERALIAVASYNEIYLNLINLNIIEVDGDKCESFDRVNEEFMNWSGTSSSESAKGIEAGRRLLSQYLSSGGFDLGETRTITRYCTKNEPIYILAVNDETTDITLWECTVTVKYRETEPYE